MLLLAPPTRTWKNVGDLSCIESPSSIIGLCLISPPRLAPARKQVCMNPSHSPISVQGWGVYLWFPPETYSPYRKASNRVYSNAV